MVTKRQPHELVDRLADDSSLARAERCLQQLLEAPGLEADEEEEDRQWLESDLSGLAELEPYEWGPQGVPLGRPIRMDPSLGLVIE